MTKAKRMLSLLLAVIMILSVIPITAGAAENDGTTGGIKTHKEYNEETGYLTLEAYVTGEPDADRRPAGRYRAGARRIRLDGRCIVALALWLGI